MFRRCPQSIPHKQMKEVHILTPYFCKIRFNLNLPLTEEGENNGNIGNIGIKLFVLPALKKH
jgi:hypothetical protein